jgi:hypothetical protein
MSSKITYYDEDFIYSFMNIRNKLPGKVYRELHVGHKIKQTMNEESRIKFQKQIDNYDETKLKKELNAYLNKISKETIVMISEKILEILKNRKVLIEYTIENIISKSMQMHLFIPVYVSFLKQILNNNTKDIFNNVFNNIFEEIEKTKISGNKNSNYDDFCKYVDNKEKYIGLFKLKSHMFKEKILNERVINKNLKYIEEKILSSTKEENNKYGEAYTTFFKILEDKDFINKNLVSIHKIKNSGLLNMRIKFQFMDIEDILKN